MIAAQASALLYRHLLRPALFSLDAEAAHHLAMRSLAACSRGKLALEMLRHLSGNVGWTEAQRARLARTVFGVRFPNPVGVAAGFDKDGVALGAWEALGFGFIEVGTLTARLQPGNPLPRLFRVPAARGLINRFGFNNGGAAAAAERFGRLRAAGRWPGVPVGINLGKSKVTPLGEAAADYAESLEKLHSFGDYFALNVSSPNTPGLRNLQGRDELDALLRAVQERNRALPAPRPMLVKIAPDLTFPQIEEVLALAQAHGLSGIIATNTTIDHSGLPPGSPQEQGGLSGEPLRERATQIVRFVAEKTALPVVAVGGVADAATAREKLDAGAALVQIYTGYVYGGPTLAPEICREI